MNETNISQSSTDPQPIVEAQSNIETQQPVESPPENQPTVVRTSRGLSVAGTRITLYTLMDYIKAEWPPHLIRDWFNLTDKQINDVLDYIEENREEVEAEYKLVLKQAAENERYWRAYNREHLTKVAKLPPKPGMEKAWAKLQVRKAELGMV